LVELIVVLTILSVLATVSYMSFQSSVVSSRDSARVSDIKSIIQALEFQRYLERRYVPPDDGVNITHL
jgi:prepilin-type N-terminal cleavage/methylation domain-containing protein